MKILRILFGRQSEDGGVSRELDEHEAQLAMQEYRLARIRHLQRERDLYTARKRREAPR